MHRYLQPWACRAIRMCQPHRRMYASNEANLLPGSPGQGKKSWKGEAAEPQTSSLANDDGYECISEAWNANLDALVVRCCDAHRGVRVPLPGRLFQSVKIVAVSLQHFQEPGAVQLPVGVWMLHAQPCPGSRLGERQQLQVWPPALADCHDLFHGPYEAFQPVLLMHLHAAAEP